MFGSFFNATEVDQYADWIVGELKRTLPVTKDPNPESLAKRVEKLNERITQKTTELAGKTSLNIYKKARLAARVREGMSAHGYPEPFVKSFSLDLLSRLAAASSRRKA